MRKADIAEGILSLTTTPQRAAATAGDLMEEASARGVVWFWSSLFRTTATLAWRNFSEAPWSLTMLAMKSMWFTCLYMIVALLCVMIVNLAISIGASPDFPFNETLNSSDVASMTLAYLASSFMMGKWLAKKAPYRELSVFVLSWVGFRFFWALLLLIRWPLSTWEGWTLADIAFDLFFVSLGMVFAYAGIERVQRHAKS